MNKIRGEENEQKGKENFFLFAKFASFCLNSFFSLSESL